MSSDPLSDVLALMNTQSLVTNGLRAGGRWSICFPPPEGIKFIAVVEGSCWLSLEESVDPLLLETGDVILVKGDRPFVLASDTTVDPIDALKVFADAVGGIVCHGGIPDVFML